MTRGTIKILVNLGPVPATFSTETPAVALLAASDPATSTDGALVRVPADAVAIIDVVRA